jgi:putative membrane protein
MSRGLHPGAILAIVLAALVFSGIDPEADRLTWLLETAPVMIGAVVLVASYRAFPLTPLTYHLLALHAFMLMLGGYYTYAEVPWFNELRDAFGLARNHYDRVAHFAQGFIPAILAREVLIRLSPLQAGKWLFFLVTCFCLALSAFYEFIEWWAAILSEEAAEAFLGTQGDHWDTQWDMFLAFIGAMVGQLTLARMHDGQIRTLTQTARP